MAEPTLVERLVYCAENGIFTAAENNMHASHREAAERITALEAALRESTHIIDVIRPRNGHQEAWQCVQRITANRNLLERVRDEPLLSEASLPDLLSKPVSGAASAVDAAGVHLPTRF